MKERRQAALAAQERWAHNLAATPGNNPAGPESTTTAALAATITPSTSISTPPRSVVPAVATTGILTAGAALKVRGWGHTYRERSDDMWQFMEQITGTTPSPTFFLLLFQVIDGFYLNL